MPCCSQTNRAALTWVPARPPILNVTAIEEDLLLKPRAAGDPAYPDLLIIDIIKDGVPLGMFISDGFAVHPNHSIHEDHHPWLRSMIASDLAKGRIEEIGPVESFETIMRSRGYKMGSISPLSTFDKNAIAQSPKFPKRNPPHLAERQRLYKSLYPGPKLRKLDDLSWPDKGGRLTRTPPSVNARYCHEPAIAYCDLRRFIDIAATFLNQAQERGVLHQVVGFKVDHAEGYKHVTLSKLLAAMHCFQLDGKAYMNLVMPFGGRPFAGIYARITTAFQWAFQRHAKRTLPDITFSMGTILDDSFYLTLQPVADALKTSVKAFHERWGLERNPAKDATEGTPSSSLIWYGIEFDLHSGTMTLPASKQHKYYTKVLELLDSVRVTPSELERVHGMLTWASAVITPGTAHLFHLRQHLSLTRPFTLSPLAVFELEFWRAILVSSGSTFSNSLFDKQQITIATDAAPAHGVGGALLTDDKLHIWSHLFSDSELTLPDFRLKVGALELFAILASFMVFAEFLKDKHVNVMTDSKSSEYIVNLRYSRKDPIAAFLLRDLLCRVARSNSSISAEHLPGHSNVIPDVLSRSGTAGLISLLQENGIDKQVKVHHLPKDALTSLHNAWTNSHIF